MKLQQGLPADGAGALAQALAGACPGQMIIDYAWSTENTSREQVLKPVCCLGNDEVMAVIRDVTEQRAYCRARSGA